MPRINTIEDFFGQYMVDQTDSLDPKGAGSVYRATDKAGKVWAVKINEVHPNFDDGLLLERYTIAQTLEHDNLLPYKEAYRFGGQLMVNVAVMPIVSMKSLDLQYDLSDEQKKLITEQVIDGVNYLHQKGIVWQNLSARHILLVKKFGNIIPKFINYGNKKRIPLAFFANYEYLAPEQFDDSAEVVEQTDFWAMGVLLYKLWTGQMPFGQKSTTLPNTKIKQRVLGDWSPGLIGEIPAPYQQIVKKCLQRKIENRWEDCGQIIAAITNHQSTIPQASPSKKEPRPPISRTKRKPLVWWQVVMWLIVAALLGYWVNKL